MQAAVRSKDLDRYVEQLVREGWTVKLGRRHRKLVPPGSGEIVTVSSTPGCSRALANMKARIKRAMRRRA